MTVYIFSQSYEIGQIINDHLITNNYSSFVFPTRDDLSKALKNLKKLPDLLMLDYTIFNHDFFNIYSYLSHLQIKLPVIFFNDPCYNSYSRVNLWLTQYEMLTYRKPNEKFTDEDIALYKNLFTKINEIIELEELAPYINLMQKTKPLPDYLKKQTISIDYIKNNNTNYIYKFRDEVKLSSRLFFLLKIFEENKGVPLTLEDILTYYKKEGKQMTENSLKVLISNLRTEMSNCKNCNFTISHHKGAYSLTGYSKS